MVDRSVTGVGRQGTVAPAEELVEGDRDGGGSSDPVDGMSVVVPTHAGRLAYLRRLLDSLEAAAVHSQEPVEVIVVDDAQAADDTEEECLARGVRYLRGPRRGGAKRNVGASVASHDLLLFVDSDCVAHQDLLCAHQKVLRAAPAEVAAAVGFTRHVGPGGWAWRLASRSGRYNSCFDWPLQYAEVLWGATANLAVRRDALVASGGFDETTWTVVGGEDVEFCARLVDRGGSIVTAVDAVVLHGRDHMTGLASLARSMLRYGAADAYLCARLPHRARWTATPAAVAVVVAILIAATPARQRKRIGRLVGAGAVAAVFGRDLVAQVERSRRVTALRARAGVTPSFEEDLVAAVSGPVPEPVRMEPGAASPTPSVRPVPVGDALCVVFDWLFDVGAAVAALRQGRPDLLARRFGYMDGKAFVAHPEPGGDA